MESPAKYYRRDIKKFLKDKSSNRFIVLDHTLSDARDVQKLARKIYLRSDENTRILVTSFNFLWKPILNFATFIGLRRPENKEPNWLAKEDIKNIFYLEGLEEIKNGNRFIFPINLGLLSKFVNAFVGNLPVINNLCLTSYQIFRRADNRMEFSVSIIIPARNEAGNVKGLLKKIPKLGTKTEVIFVEGGSSDSTYSQIENEIKNNKPSWMSVKLFKQKGKGKKDAVKMGFSKAKNQLLMILDADLTVKPEELIKFYKAACENKGELIIGSRLVYPMEKQAMRLLNYLGNKMFSVIFSFILEQKVKDTLCGTKVILKSNYNLIRSNQKYFGMFDPFGDFDLIFGAARLNLKITEIPIRYGGRTYGTTNISRFRHGLLLAKMAWIGAFKIRFQ